MGIRVDEDSLHEQLKTAGCEEREELAIPEGIAERRASIYHRRRYRTVPYLYVLLKKSPYR